MVDAPPPPPPANPHLVAFLADRDEPCPACMYNLRGLQSDRCPECNRELALQLRLAEPRIGAWVAAIAAAAAMLGFNGMLVIYFLLYVLRRRAYGTDVKGVASLVISAIIAATILFLLIRRRREYGNLSIQARLFLAAGAWMLTVASAFSFFSLIDK